MNEKLYIPSEPLTVHLFAHQYLHPFADPEIEKYITNKQSPNENVDH